jgi:hypothetical protein
MAFTALVAIGCTDSPTQPTGQGEVATPVTNYMNGPEQPGPTVYRSEDGQVLVWTFPADATPDGEDWSVMFSIGDVADLQFCGGTGTPYPGSVQQAFTDDGFNIVQMRKKVPAYAAHASDFDAYDICDKMSVPWVAVGEANVFWTGHVRAGDEGSSGHSKLSFNAFLDDVDTGDSYHAHWNFAWAWPPFEVLADNMFIK